MKEVKIIALFCTSCSEIFQDEPDGKKQEANPNRKHALRILRERKTKSVLSQIPCFRKISAIQNQKLIMEPPRPISMSDWPIFPLLNTT